MEVTGQIIEWVDNVHVLLEDNDTNKYYVGINSSISQLQVGNIYSGKIYPRYQVLKIVSNPFGTYKLLFQILNDVKFNNQNVYFYFFLNKNNNEIISTTFNDVINDAVVGEFYDLDEIVKDYKVRNVLPFLPENKNCSYTKVLLTNKLDNYRYFGYIGNEQVYLSSDELIFDSYLGKNVWMEIQPKYLSINLVPGLKQIEPSKGDFELIVNFSNKYYMRQLDKTNPTFTPLRVLDGLYKINSNNIGKIINLNYYKIKIILVDTLQITNNISDNQLVQIIIKENCDSNINLFRLGSTNEIIAINSLQGINLNNKLGSYFKFVYKQLYYLTRLSYSNDPDTNYTLSAILNNRTYKFTKNNEDFYVDIGNFVIADSSIGKVFSLELKEYYITDFVNNVIDI